MQNMFDMIMFLSGQKKQKQEIFHKQGFLEFIFYSIAVVNKDVKTLTVEFINSPQNQNACNMNMNKACITFQGPALNI